MLHRLAELDAKVREAYANFDYARVVAALSAFMNADLSAFYFDIRKDALYCDPPSSAKRRGALEAIEHIFRAVTLWLAPILVFTAEEAWAVARPGRALRASRAVSRDSRRMARRGAGGEMGDDPPRPLRRHRRDRDRARRQEIGSSLEATPARLRRATRRYIAALEASISPKSASPRTSRSSAERARPKARFACPIRPASRSWWSAPRASNARARGAISIPRRPIPNFPTSPRATRRRCAN